MARGDDDSEATAIRMLASRNLHQCFWLPRTASHESLRVTFSTTSNFEDESLPVVLFIGPMFGIRYINLMFDKLAQSEGLRVICVDRPGIGGASAVPVGQRIRIWLETMPALLEHLNVRHVHILTHSAGAPYTLNTLVHLRSLLDPRTPYVAFLAPWVHCDQSKKTLWKAASVLPVGLVSHLDDVTKFIQQTVVPATSWSGGVFSSLSSLFQAAPGSDPDDEAQYQEKYGIDEQTGKLLTNLKFKYAFTEGMSGGGEEAVLCLKKAGEGAWGACEDYMSCITELACTEKARQSTTGAKIRIRLHFAGSDIMIGKGGREYFEQCWQQDAAAGAFDVQCSEWPDADHETLLVDWSKGAIKAVFADIRRTVGSPDE